MRWILTAGALLAFLGASQSTPGWMFVLIMLGFALSFAAVFAFAGARIDARSQEQVYVPSREEIEAIKRQQAARGPKPVRPAAPAAKPAPTHDGTMALKAVDLAKLRKPTGDAD
jgi:hypothetical protein